MSIAKVKKQKGYPKKDHVYLFQLPCIWGMNGSISPFCEKVEVYLRTYNIPYDIIITVNTKESPNGKLPYILINNELIADSSCIIPKLNKIFNVNPDAEYTEEEVAIGHGFQRLLEEHFYFCMGYFRFADPEYWPATKEAFFGELPPVVRQLVPRFVQGPVKKSLQQQGVGRHSRDDIISISNDDLRAISDFLGDKNFLLGNNLSTVDFSLYAFLSNVLATPLPIPPKQFILEKAKNLDAYHKRHTDRFWKDSAKKTVMKASDDDVAEVKEINEPEEKEPEPPTKENASVECLKMVSRLTKEGRLSENEGKSLKRLALKKEDSLLNAWEAFRTDESEFVETAKLLCE